MHRFKWDKKYLYWGVTAFCVITCAILFFMAMQYLPILGVALKKLTKILSPFIWGIVISYLLTPGMHSLERRVVRPAAEKLCGKKHPERVRKLARGTSVLLMIILFLAIIATLVYLILPQIYQSLETIVSNSSVYIGKASEWVQRTLEDYPEIESYAMNAIGSVNESLMDWISSSVLPELGSLLTNVTAGVYYVLVGVYNLIIGVIVSVYILSNVEKVCANAKKLLYSTFRLETADKIRRAVVFTDKTITGFINGKLLDSAIIGFICYVVCAILNMPYTLLISVIVGVTNIIPFFGPIIGAVPCSLIILLVDPLKCLIFVIFIIILQQVDGNIIGPKILGSSIGINGFWVMFSIVLGAGLFGFWGMLLGVPVFVVIYTGISLLIERRLKNSDLPWETAEYVEMDHIDPATGKPVMKTEEHGEKSNTEEKPDKPPQA